MAHMLLGLLLGLVAPQVPRAPYVATPPDVVDRMLDLASITSRDVLYDLGCGDGRIVIAAARKFGARGVGVDIDPARIAEAQLNAARAQVEHVVLALRAERGASTKPHEATSTRCPHRVAQLRDGRLGSGRRRYVHERGRAVADVVLVENSRS